MTVMIYRECRIEIERDGSTFSFSIWDSNKHLIVNDSVELSKSEVMADCQSYVDDYLKNPGEYL